MISILLATYNGEKYLSHAIESVLNQSFKDFELLIGLNNCWKPPAWLGFFPNALKSWLSTTDNSREIINRYDDSRIRIFDYDEKGKSKTLNKLLNEAKYDWIALQDDDDVWLNNKLEKQILLIEKYDVIGTFINYINAEGNVTGRPELSSCPNDIRHLSMSGANQVANTSAIFKKLDAIEIGGWKDGLDGIEDYDFWLRLMRAGKMFINIPEELVHHRLHSNSHFNTKKYDLSKIL